MTPPPWIPTVDSMVFCLNRAPLRKFRQVQQVIGAANADRFHGFSPGVLVVDVVYKQTLIETRHGRALNRIWTKIKIVDLAGQADRCRFRLIDRSGETVDLVARERTPFGSIPFGQLVDADPESSAV